MTRGSAIFWVPLGFVVAVIDGWLSVLSVLGVIHSSTAVGYLTAGVSGVAMTVYAILFPAMRGPDTAALFWLLWVVLVIFDVGTSVLGAIWYGIMGMAVGTQIKVSELQYDPDNWLETCIFIGVVLFAAYSCHKLGAALRALRTRV